MEEITVSQIVSSIGSITAIAVFFIAIYKWYKKAIIDEFNKINQEINNLKENYKKINSEMEDSKEERLILVQGLLACLKGLREQGCDGPVKEGIENIENYLIKKTH